MNRSWKLPISPNKILVWVAMSHNSIAPIPRLWCWTLKSPVYLIQKRTRSRDIQLSFSEAASHSELFCIFFSKPDTTTPTTFRHSPPPTAEMTKINSGMLHSCNTYLFLADECLRLSPILTKSSPPLLAEKVSQGSLRCTFQRQTYDHERAIEQGAPREIQRSYACVWGFLLLLTPSRSAPFPSERTTKSLSCEALTRVAKARSPPSTVSSTSSTSSASSRRSRTVNRSPSASTPRKSSSPSWSSTRTVRVYWSASRLDERSRRRPSRRHKWHHIERGVFGMICFAHGLDGTGWLC